MADLNTGICSARACNQPVHELGPRTGTPLCREHFAKELQKVTQQKDRLLKKLRALRDSADRAQLRLEHSALQAELEEASDMFDAVQETLQQWRQRTLSRVQAVLDSVAGRLRDAAESEQSEKDVAAACDAGDMRRLAELTASTELWLDEATERSDQFDEARSKLRERQSSARLGLSSDAIVRSVGDVAAGVQELRFITDRHMASVLRQCWLDDADTSSGSRVCQPVSPVGYLKNYPWLVTSCSNTAGFGADSSGRVVKAKSADLTPLPDPCILVAFSAHAADHLMVTSLDGAVRLKFHADLDWSEFITGLHCDSERQLLFVAQCHGLTVTDLSGEVKRVITAESLHLSSVKILGIDGDMDKLFLLDDKSNMVHMIGKDCGQLQSSLQVSKAKKGSFTDLALLKSKILLVDSGGKVCRICGISGQLVSSYPHDQGVLNRPGKIGTDSRGVLFVSEQGAHTVRAFSSTGATLEVLGVQGKRGSDGGHFRLPCGLAVARTKAEEFLVVADNENCRLCVFRLC